MNKEKLYFWYLSIFNVKAFPKCTFQSQYMPDFKDGAAWGILPKSPT